VSSFVHPALALRDDSSSIVPIDLTISDDEQEAHALIISGPNGGGAYVLFKVTTLLPLSGECTHFFF
jgi:hypothetical protein